MTIRQRLMPGTSLELSVICLGSCSIGGEISEDESYRLLDAYAELGGNFVDTAEVYSNWLPGEPSRAERRIGAWLRSRGMRGRVVVATKGGHPRLATMNVPRLARAEILFDIDASRERLGLDQLPFFLLHRDNPAQPVDEMIATLGEAVTTGRVAYAGVSNWSAKRIGVAQEFAARHGLPPLIVDQMRWSLACVNPASQQDQTLVEMDAPLWDYHRATGLAAMAYSSQAQGFFSGAYGRDIDPPAKSKGAKIKSYYYNERNLACLERVGQLARQLGRPPTQMALAYLVNQPFATYALVGCSTVEHLRESAAAHDIDLAPAQVRWLESGHS